MRVGSSVPLVVYELVEVSAVAVERDVLVRLLDQACLAGGVDRDVKAHLELLQERHRDFIIGIMLRQAGKGLQDLLVGIY